jgi:regulator of sigma E protease
MGTITYILPAVILLGLCIFVHELGHLLGGMMVGIKARTFSIGYGKGFIKKKWGDTTYQITLIPFGGFCSFYGDNPTEELEGKSYEFLTAAPWRRMVAVIMGPLFNLIFGILLLLGMNLVGFEIETNRIHIPELAANSNYPAYSAGLRSGDTITKINGAKILSFLDIQSKIVFSGGKNLEFTVERTGQEKNFNVIPQQSRSGGYYSIGIIPYGESILITAVQQGSPAATAGIEQYDEIISINGEKITSSEQFVSILRKSPGKSLNVDVMRNKEKVSLVLVPETREELTVTSFQDSKFPDKTHSITLNETGLIKEAIKDGSVKIDGEVVSSYTDFTNRINNAAKEGTSLTLENRSGVYSGIFSYKTYGFIGVGSTIAPEMKFVRYPIGPALVKSVQDPFDFVVMNLKGIAMIFTGQIDARENLSGPVRIAKIAGDTVKYRGVREYIILMARISIILMVMNLLPIPAVDGSHLIIYTVEMVRGKPVPPAILERIQMVGFFIILAIGVFALWNDITQLL